MKTSRNSALEELLVGLFSEPELRSLLAAVGGDDLTHHLPSSATPAVLAADAVIAMRRRGLIDDAWFDRLVEKRPRRADEIDAVRGLWTGELAGVGRSTPRLSLASVPSFVAPATRRSEGGLRLIDVRPGPPDTSQAPLPVFRFTLTNESSRPLALSVVKVDALLHETWAVLSLARPIAPSVAWDLEIPEDGGQRTFFAEPVFALAPGDMHMIEVRCHVLRNRMHRVPPQHCGRFTLQFCFVAGEDAWALSEPIPC